MANIKFDDHLELLNRGLLGSAFSIVKASRKSDKTVPDEFGDIISSGDEYYYRVSENGSFNRIKLTKKSLLSMLGLLFGEGTRAFFHLIELNTLSADQEYERRMIGIKLKQESKELLSDLADIRMATNQ